MSKIDQAPRFSIVEKEVDKIDVAAQKKNLRRQMKRKRGEAENRDLKEERALAFFLETQFAKKETFFVYLSFSSEMPTDKLIEWLLSNGKKVYCPILRDGEMYAVAYGEDFSLSDYGIREPIGEIYDGEIDVAILPLLAVDKTGERLGYGGGYYDRFLNRHLETTAVGWCFDFQIIEKVPKEEWDKPIAWIVTECGVYDCRKVFPRE